MEFKHNKKRNIGLISEFFSRYIAEAFIDERHDDIAKARKLWEKHVHPKSATYTELQVFNALHESNLKSKEIAFSMLEKAKAVCKKQSQLKLDEEKASLINEVSSILGDKSFFDRSVPDYKTFASVQVLMNAWRGTGFKGSISEMAQLEEMILEHILTVKNKPEIDASDVTTSEVNSLVVKLMTEKFNAKYNGLLNEAQKEIVNLYMLSHSSKENREHLVSLLENLKVCTLKSLKSPVMTEGLDRILKSKLGEVIYLLEGSDLSNITDETITFYMSVAKLKEEMENKS
jgi:hypothetical protein